MAVREIPQIELERVAEAGAQIVDVAKYLASLIRQIENPSVAAAVEGQVSRLLDVAERLSTAATNAARDRLK